MTYYEDVEPGATREFGEYEVTESEIIEFAGQYDPQPFHVDPEAAEESFFGELVASGWHTAAMTMRMIVDNHINRDGRVLGAAGVEDLEWRSPTKPGQVLHVESEILDKEPWQPGIGLVRTRTSTVTDEGVEVMRMVARVLYERRGE